MVARDLRRRAQAAIDELGLEGPISNDRLKTVLEELRGRPIFIQTAPAEMFASSACGAWWETTSVDVILVPEDVDPLLRAHTVRHEFAHMILRHCGAVCGSVYMTEVLAQILPDLDPEKVLGMLARSDFSGHGELEAEMLASLLTLRANDAEDSLANAETEALRRALAGTVRRG